MTDQTKESGELYIYRIDTNDDITYVSDNWSTFADENRGSKQSASSLVLGKSLWNFISDRQTRHIYKALLNQVREHKKSVRLPINCGSPDIKRYIEITLKPLENGAVEFLSKITKRIQRDAVTILDKATERTVEIPKMCSFCKNIAISTNRV